MCKGHSFMKIFLHVIVRTQFAVCKGSLVKALQFPSITVPPVGGHDFAGSLSDPTSSSTFRGCEFSLS